LFVVLDLSSCAKAAEDYIAHPENEEVPDFDKQTSLKMTSKKVILWSRYNTSQVPICFCLDL